MGFDSHARYLAVPLLLAVSLLAAGPLAHHSDAASVSALLATAEHNTNTVNTLVHSDVMTITTSQVIAHVTSRGTEDEVRNREQDHESVTATRQLAGGKTQKVQYTLDLIFMNGSTYYRTSSAPTQWKIKKGMQFPDPFLGGWKRGRTTVTLPASLKFKDAGVDGGKTHLRATFANKSTAGTVDLWLSAGSKPFVVRELESYHTVTGTKGSVTRGMTFSNFNHPVTIQPPAQAST